MTASDDNQDDNPDDNTGCCPDESPDDNTGWQHKWYRNPVDNTDDNLNDNPDDNTMVFILRLRQKLLIRVGNASQYIYSLKIFSI
jgi:hypothetical protein